MKRFEEIPLLIIGLKYGHCTINNKYELTCSEHSSTIIEA